jgi:hypothetical protein
MVEVMFRPEVAIGLANISIEALKTFAESCGADYQALPGLSSTLAIICSIQFQHTQAQQDLQQAITIGQKAFDLLTPEWPPETVCEVATKQAQAMSNIFEVSGNKEHLDTAISASEIALGCSSTHCTSLEFQLAETHGPYSAKALVLTVILGTSKLLFDFWKNIERQGSSRKLACVPIFQISTVQAYN